MKTRVPGESYREYKERQGKSTLTRKQEKEWKNREKEARKSNG